MIARGICCLLFVFKTLQRFRLECLCAFRLHFVAMVPPGNSGAHVVFIPSQLLRLVFPFIFVFVSLQRFRLDFLRTFRLPRILVQGL